MGDRPPRRADAAHAEGEQQLRQGDVVAFPRGKEGAHQIRDDTDAPVRVLMLSTLIAPDIVETWTPARVSARSVAGERIISLARGLSSNIGRTRKWRRPSCGEARADDRCRNASRPFDGARLDRGAAAANHRVTVRTSWGEP